MGIRLCYFDFDGVLADDGGMPPPVRTMLAALERKKLLAGINTSRNYRALCDGIREEDHLSFRAPLILESGALILWDATFAERSNRSHTRFSNRELVSLETALSTGVCVYAAFCAETEERYRMFFGNPALRERLLATKAKNFVSETTFDLGDFMAWMRKLVVGQVIVKLIPGVANFPVEGLESRRGFVREFGEHVVITPAGTNKGSALREVCQHIGVPLWDVLVAGNDEQDISMFLPEVGTRIAVGESLPAGLMERKTHQVASPSALAELVMSLLD